MYCISHPLRQDQGEFISNIFKSVKAFKPFKTHFYLQICNVSRETLYFKRYYSIKHTQILSKQVGKSKFFSVFRKAAELIGKSAHRYSPTKAVGHCVHLAKSDQGKFLRSFFQKATKKNGVFFLRSFFFCASCVKRKSERMKVNFIINLRTVLAQIAKIMQGRILSSRFVLLQTNHK